MTLSKPTVDLPASAPADLVIEDLAIGEGDEAKPGKVVTVHYVGVALSTGKEFDASWKRKETFDFVLGRGEVIQGWDKGVVGMRVGGRRQLIIPGHMAYGQRGVPGVIKANETLVFVVDLIDVT